MKIINRDIIKTLEIKGIKYGQDKKGQVYKLATGTEKIKGTIDEYTWVRRWVQVHYASYEKMGVINAFKNI